MSLIGTLIAVAVMSVVTITLTNITLTMIKNNTTAMANSDILAYVNQLRSNIQYVSNSSISLAGNTLTGAVTLKDPLTGAVIAQKDYKQTPLDVWKVKSLRFSNVVSVPSQANLYRGTLVISFDLDRPRVSGSSVITKTIGDVYCLAPSGTISTCYGSTDLVTMAESACLALGGIWDVTKPFGKQCVLSAPPIVTGKQ